jgi:hypothetical protein
MKFLDLPIYPADWPALWQERYEERAALMEYGANLPRDVAERNAETNTRGQLDQDERTPRRVPQAPALFETRDSPEDTTERVDDIHRPVKYTNEPSPEGRYKLARFL